MLFVEGTASLALCYKLSNLCYSIHVIKIIGFSPSYATRWYRITVQGSSITVRALLVHHIPDQLATNIKMNATAPQPFVVIVHGDTNIAWHFNKPANNWNIALAIIDETKMSRNTRRALWAWGAEWIRENQGRVVITNVSQEEVIKNITAAFNKSEAIPRANVLWVRCTFLLEYARLWYFEPEFGTLHEFELPQRVQQSEYGNIDKESGDEKVWSEIEESDTDDIEELDVDNMEEPEINIANKSEVDIADELKIDDIEEAEVGNTTKMDIEKPESAGEDDIRKNDGSDTEGWSIGKPAASVSTDTPHDKDRLSTTANLVRGLTID